MPSDGTFFVFVLCAEEYLLADMQDVGRVCLRGGDIMADHENGHAFLVELADQAIKLCGCLRIETGHRLIQQNDLAGCEACPRQKNPLLLAAGELPVAFPGHPVDAEARHDASDFLFFLMPKKGTKTAPSHEAAPDDFLYGSRKIALQIGLLRQIADLVPT